MGGVDLTPHMELLRFAVRRCRCSRTDERSHTGLVAKKQARSLAAGRSRTQERRTKVDAIWFKAYLYDNMVSTRISEDLDGQYVSPTNVLVQGYDRHRNRELPLGTRRSRLLANSCMRWRPTSRSHWPWARSHATACCLSLRAQPCAR